MPQPAGVGLTNPQPQIGAAGTSRPHTSLNGPVPAGLKRSCASLLSASVILSALLLGGCVRMIRSQGDPCECEPYNPLLYIYLNQTHEYDKARDIAAQAHRAKQWIDPRYLAQLKTAAANR